MTQTQTTAHKSPVAAVVSVVLGAAGLLAALLTSFGLLSVAAVVVGVIGRRNPTARGVATTGIVFGAVGVAIAVALAVTHAIAPMSVGHLG